MSSRTGWLVLAVALSFGLGCGGPPPSQQPPGNDAGVLDPPDEPDEPDPPDDEPDEPDPPDDPRFVPVQKSLQTYGLEISPEALALFEQDIWTPEQPATFVYNGNRYPVMVRLRGASAREFPKKSWNVDFGDRRFEGREELNLVAEYQDCTLMAEKLAYDVLLHLGVPAPRTKYVRVVLNGVEQGAYLDIEEVDKKFLVAHGFADPDGTVYRCGWKDCEMKTWKVPYQGNWKRRTNQDENDDTALQDVLRAINFTPEPLLQQTLNERLQLEHHLRAMAMDALMSNNYVEDSESYFVHDRVSGKWSYVPWDLNNVDARFWKDYTLDAQPIVNHPLIGFSLLDAWTDRMYQRRKDLYEGYLPVFSNLNTRIALNPALRARLLELIETALADFFNPEVLHPWIDATHARIAPAMKGDPYIDPAKFAAGRHYLKNYVSGRVAYLTQQLETWRARKLGLAFSAFDPAQGWVEIGNYGETAANTEGVTFTTNLRQPFAVPLPPHTLPPGEKLRLQATELGVTFPPEGEIGLFRGPSVVGVLDALFYGALPAGQIYARAEARPTAWRVR